MKKKLILLELFAFVVGLGGTSPIQASDPDLVAWWEFDEGSGATTTDSSPNKVQGTLVNGPVWRQDGVHKGCLFFDGDQAHVRVPDQESLNPGTGSFTYAFWANVEKTPGTRGTANWDLPVAKRESNGSIGYYIGADRNQGTADETGYRFMLGDTSATRKDTPYATVPLGEWVFVAAVLDRDLNEQKISVDGAQTWLKTTPPPGPIAPNMDLGIGWDIGQNNYWTHGRVDDVALFSRALTDEEIQQVMLGIPHEIASDPFPADRASDIPRDVVLTWSPGDFAPAANGHTLYISKNLDDVNNGVGGITLSKTSYVPTQRLDLETIYYWRVDEVNAPPDSTVYPGEVWSFTTEPVGYPIDGANIIVTASSQAGADVGPEKTIDGSGLDENDLHSTEPTDMWLSSSEPSGAWIQYEFDNIYKLHKMWVWNSNQLFENMFLGFGFRNVTVEYSTDGTNWTALAGVPEFTRAPGADGYAHDTTVDFGGAVAKYVRLTAVSNWSDVLPQFGLSEVRFFYRPLLASEPYPAPGAADIPVDVTLSWRAGREASEHEVFIGSDEQAVIDGTAPVTTVTEAAHGPLSLDLGQMYYWRIVEVNNVETPSKWQGNVLDFTTQTYIVVDDFELYNDIPADQPNSNLVYLTWVDGFDNPNVNGSTMGYVTGASMETDNVHGGEKSVPMEYNNTTAPVSEVTANLANLPVGSDWTKHGIRSLSLWFSGAAGNTGQLYVKINGSKVVYDGEPSNLQKGWQVWNIESSDFEGIGVDLQNVTTISIGVEGANATGTLLLDDIRLYPYGRELVTPVEPGTAGLIGYWKLDGDPLDYSGRGNNGIPMGDSTYEMGKDGQAMKFDGGGDYLVIDGVADDLTNNDVTLSAWVKTADTGSVYWFSCNTASGGNVAMLGILGGQFAIYDLNRAEGYSKRLVNDLEWHHLAYTRSGDLGSLYVDGVLEGTHAANFNYSADDLWSIGQEWDGTTASNFLTGSVDDVRVYDIALSYGEIAWLAGRTLPFDKSLE